MKRWRDVSDAGSTPAAYTTYFYVGVMVSTGQTSYRGESAMLKPLGLGFTRSKKQTKIVANDDFYSENLALVA